MNLGPELLLVGAVGAVGVLHTIVPDHWVPIALIARQRGWTKAETARASLVAGLGHVLSTLAIALLVWFAGLAVAARFGQLVDTAASLALIGFGGWIAVSAWRELRGRGGAGHRHGHGHTHGHGHSNGHVHTHRLSLDDDEGEIHGPERQRIATDHGELVLSIFERGMPPRFRLTGVEGARVTAETLRSDGTRQVFQFANRGTYWESTEKIPEPLGFDVAITIEHNGHLHHFETAFSEHEPEWSPRNDPLYAPLRGETAVLTRHIHIHRHGRGPAHIHWHDHTPETTHPMAASDALLPPLHAHRHKTSARTALLLILGSSPMVEGIPAFFAAAKYGTGLIIAMSIVFALSTIATYMLLCVFSTAGLQRLRLGALERYGEVLSGAVIAVVGLVFWIWPVL